MSDMRAALERIERWGCQASAFAGEDPLVWDRCLDYEYSEDKPTGDPNVDRCDACVAHAALAAPERSAPPASDEEPRSVRDAYMFEAGVEEGKCLGRAAAPTLDAARLVAHLKHMIAIDTESSSWRNGVAYAIECIENEIARLPTDDAILRTARAIELRARAGRR